MSMVCVVKIFLVALQVSSYLCVMNMLTNPNEWEDDHLTKKNFLLLIIPFGYVYFIYMGVIMVYKFIVNFYKELK